MKIKNPSYYTRILSGERGIRTPGPVTVNGFQDRRIRPLCHLSAAKVRFQYFSNKNICHFIKKNQFLCI